MYDSSNIILLKMVQFQAFFTHINTKSDIFSLLLDLSINSSDNHIFMDIFAPSGLNYGLLCL